MNFNDNKKLKMFNTLMILELILLMCFLSYTPLFILERIIAMCVVIYLNIVCYLSLNDSKISELLGFVDNSDYYQTYLNIVIDTLKIADKAIYKANLIGNVSDYRVKDSVEVVRGCLQYLKTIEPPKKYNKYHKNILEDLNLFLEEFKS